MPLIQHLEDTCNVIDGLWEHWLSSGQKRFIVRSLNKEDEYIAKQLTIFLAATHDIGKATPAFSTKKSWNSSLDIDHQIVSKLEYEGFENIGDFNDTSANRSPHALAGQYILQNYGVNEGITSIIGGHHGLPIDDISLCKEQSSYEENYFQVSNPESPIHVRWKGVQDDILEWALERARFSTISDLPVIENQMAQVILSGLLIMADWIASNEEYFPLISIEDDQINNSKERFIKGWEKWKKTDVWEPTILTMSDKLFQQRFIFSPRDFQRRFCQVIADIQNPGLFILEAPMGLGKTEAALMGAELLASKTGRSGLFFGLPTQATSNGIFPRIYDWIEKLEVEDDRFGLRLAHGKASLNDFYQSLASNIEVDNLETNISTNEWFSGRKTTALDDFVVGTVDQFLLSALKQKHLALRHLGITKKVVIIDEVHSYDAYISQYLQMALSWMGAYGVPVIILSATLPQEIREDLLTSYLIGKGMKQKQIIRHDNQISPDDYPLVSYTEGNEVYYYNEFKETEDINVKVNKIKEEELISLLDQLIIHKGVIGIVVNTVSKAQELAKKCSEKYGEDLIDVLHSSFIATDRAKKEQNLLNQIGKGKARPERKIIIGTQVIEQSLDIDFDVMISELAPMDLLIQRIGRLHRHHIDRSSFYKNPVLYVMGTSEELDFDNGSESIYGGYLLGRTQFYLPQVIRLPSDISKLVQQVYEKDGQIEISQNLEDTYQSMKTKHLKLIANKKSRAKTYRLADPIYKPTIFKRNSLIGWLSKMNPNEHEEFGLAQVRDAQETIEVIALKQYEDGYSFIDVKENLADKLEKGCVRKEIAKHTLRLPNVLSRDYNVENTIEELENYYLKYFSNWRGYSWLEGNLVILFDENNEFKLGGYCLRYDQKYGLTYEKEECHVKV